MYCPFCNAQETKVVDSRLDTASNQVRRRRECAECRARFTTFEKLELQMPRVIKRDGGNCSFDESKLRKGLLTALEKRPVSLEQVDELITSITHQIRSLGEREVSTQTIGEIAMDALRNVDQVAYVRFASVYRSFGDVNAFREVLSGLDEGEGV